MHADDLLRIIIFDPASEHAVAALAVAGHSAGQQSERTYCLEDVHDPESEACRYLHPKAQHEAG